jgi:hypothetical protein
MSKIHLLSGWILVLAMLLASCGSYTTLPGKVDGGFPGQATPLAGNKLSGQAGAYGSNPEIVTVVNTDPQHSNLPQETITPQTLLSQPAQSAKNSNVTDWPVYQDTVNHFQISYPPQFEFKVLDNSELVKMKPEPVAVTYFNDTPTTAGLLVPPKFSLRIYKIGAGTSVENWLKTNGLYQPDSDWTIAKYQGEHFSGYQVNSALYMTPGWFIYTVQGEYLYQLTPLGSDAEKMLNTFEFTK